MAKKDNKVTMSIKGYDPQNETNKHEDFKAALEKGSVASEIKEAGLLYSKADYPVTLKYTDGEELHVSPKAFALPVDLARIDKNNLPKELVVKEN